MDERTVQTQQRAEDEHDPEHAAGKQREVAAAGAIAAAGDAATGATAGDREGEVKDDHGEHHEEEHRDDHLAGAQLGDDVLAQQRPVLTKGHGPMPPIDFVVVAQACVTSVAHL